jgi:hypothetical protein
MKSLTADDGKVWTILQIFKKQALSLTNRSRDVEIVDEMVDDTVLEKGNENFTRYKEYEALDTENEAIAIIEDQDGIQLGEANNKICFEQFCVR